MPMMYSTEKGRQATVHVLIAKQTRQKTATTLRAVSATCEPRLVSPRLLVVFALMITAVLSMVPLEALEHSAAYVV